MATTPATLQDLAGQVRDLYQDAKSDAQKDLATAQAGLTAARQAQADDTASLVAKNAEIAGKQAQLAASSEVPVDATALLAEIATAQVEARALQATLLDDGDAVAAAEARVAAAQGFLAKMSAAGTRADGAIAAADADEKRRKGWRDAAPGLDTSVAAAAQALLADGNSVYGIAKQRVEAAVPAKLLAAARQGYAVENRRRDALEDSAEAIQDLLADYEKNDGGPDGNAAFLRLQLDRAESALRGWSDNAAARYALAVAQLTVLAPPEPPTRPPIFTTAEQERLNDAGALAAREAAADQRNLREDARADLFEAQDDAADADTIAHADDPTGYDELGSPPSSPPDSSPPGSPPDDVAAAQAAFDAQDAAYTAAMRTDFSGWSAAVPEATWRKLVGFVEAEATLQELAGDTSGPLLTAAADAEADLAEALWNAERHAVTVAYLEEQVNLREGLLARAVSVRQQRLLSALRGDA